MGSWRTSWRRTRQCYFTATMLLHDEWADEEAGEPPRRRGKIPGLAANYSYMTQPQPGNEPARTMAAAAPVARFPESPYRLHQLFPTAGDQPEAIDKLV